MMKSNLKVVIAFIIGLIISGATVYAINASEITYNDTTVASALDTLYQRSTYTEYSGLTTITPTATAQTLETNNKLLKSNITIDAIPSTYKNLSTASNFAAGDLASGKTAYDSDGNLVIGTNTLTGKLVRSLIGFNYTTTSRHGGGTNFSGPELNYKYFKVTSVTKGNNTSKCGLIGWSSIKQANVTLSTNTQYNVNDSTDGNQIVALFIDVTSSAENKQGRCDVTVEFYN